MISAYIAGTLGGREKSVVLKERAEAVRPLRKAGWDVYDPFEDESSQVKRLIPNNHDRATMAAFINKDLRKVRKCDVIFVLTGDSPTDGTWDEKCQAWHQGSVVILVAPKRKSGELVSFSNIRSHWLASSIEEAVEWALSNVHESEDGGLYLKGNVWP